MEGVTRFKTFFQNQAKEKEYFFRKQSTPEESKFFQVFNNDEVILFENLKCLQVDEKNCSKIIMSIKNWDHNHHLLGALKFLTEIKHVKSRRENFYEVSKFISEFYCTISNLGLFAVAYQYNDVNTLMAALFSALSHAFPLQRFQELDILGVVFVLGNVLANYHVLFENREVIFYGVSAITVNIIDTVISRMNYNKFGPLPHVIWHFLAALALAKFNEHALFSANSPQT